MQKKRLNITKAKEAASNAGLSLAAIAEKLDVSREAVSQWFSEKVFPRPNKLLQLGKLLGLSFHDLVLVEGPFEPKVAFRKMKGTKTEEHHVEKAQEMGRFLRYLVPFLPFETLETPSVLKQPNCDYDYLLRVSKKVRNDIGVESTAIVDFHDLIRRFRDLQVVIIPVLWGNKQRHENAVHIYLPDSQSTWVYLNLDTNIHDFKFWMAHELGHCLSPSLEGNNAEEFADAFAGSLLYPHELAEKAYISINQQSAGSTIINHVLSLASEQVISPYTIIKQVNKYAKSVDKSEIKLDDAFNGAVTNFNKKYPNLSNALFSNIKLDEHDKPNARDYIAKVENAFETPFFDILRQYLARDSKGPGFIQTVLDMPLLDARSIYAELT